MQHDEVVRLAEQSTLGALMLRPAALSAVREWLRPDDFDDVWHGQVYTALLERQLVGGMDPHSMAAVLVDRLGTRHADLPRFADLLRVTPHDPDPVAYARMVVDNGLRREAAGLGVFLRAAALASTNERASGPIGATCGLVDAGLDAVEHRWGRAEGRARDDVVVPLQFRAAARNTGLPARLGADKYLAAHPGRDRDTERLHVAQLVGTLVCHPELIAAVASWLPPVRVEDTGWRVLYGTVVELAELDRHIDLTTVAWAAHAHAHHGPDLPSVEALRGIVNDAWYAYPPDVIKSVAADQARQIADIGSAHLHAAATTPSLTIGDVVDAGHAVTTTLRAIGAALDAGGRPAPAQREVQRTTVTVSEVSR